MPNNITNIVTFDCDSDRMKQIMNELHDEQNLGIIDFNKIIPMPDNIFKGNLGPAEKESYGKDNWYDWSVANWNTKWNAYGLKSFPEYDGGDIIQFYTAWTAPHPIIQKLSEMFPDIVITHNWVDEDFGMNCGYREYLGSEITNEFIPDGGTVDAYNFAAETLKCNISDYGLRMNSDGSNYICIDDEKYELVELFGKPALFTNERMKLSDIPQGLYKCDVRGDDETTGWFAELAPSVLVNHFGTIITDEPIDFGDDGFIILNDDTAPNFLDQSLSFDQYINRDFEQKEGMSLE